MIKHLMSKYDTVDIAQVVSLQAVFTISLTPVPLIRAMLSCSFLPTSVQLVSYAHTPSSRTIRTHQSVPKLTDMSSDTT